MANSVSWSETPICSSISSVRRVHDGGARRVRTRRLPIDDRDVVAMAEARVGNRQAHGPRADDEHLGATGKLTHRSLLPP